MNDQENRNDRLIQIVCISVCIIGALILKSLMGFQGILYGALFGGGGGAFGGLLAMVIIGVLRGGKKD